MAGWYGKNYAIAGRFASSTLMGIGLYNITTNLVPQRLLVPLVEKGVLTPWALISRYDPNQPIFRTNIRPPTSTHQYFSEANQTAVAPMEAVFIPLLSGVSAQGGEMILSPAVFPHPLVVHTSVPLIIVWVGLLGFGYVQARKEAQSRDRPRDPRRIVIGFIALTGAYLYAVSTFLELGENNRYRFEIEPLFFVLAAAAVMAIIQTIVRAVRVRKLKAVAVKE